MSFGYDGSIRIDTKINSRNVKTGIKDMVTNMTAGVNKMLASLGKLTAAVGLAFSVNAVINFGRESVNAASNLSSALIGLQSIVEGQGKSFSQAQEFIKDYIKDGLVPLENAVTAYKNLSMRGYSTEQIEQTLIALKAASVFGRQASLTMGQAVASATEGLKNENSILVDNAGVTKNVSVMWKEYADSIGVGVQSLTKQQKIQAEVNGILHETRFQTGDAAKAVDTYAGQVAMLSFNLQQLKVAVGNAIIPVIQAAIPAVNTLISSLTELANVFAQVTTALFGPKEQAEADEELADSNKDAADSAKDLADATEDVGKATEKAAKKVKGSLAPFDDLKKISASTADSLEETADDINEGLDLEGVGEGGTLWGNVEVSPEILAFVEELKRKLEELAQVFERVWKPFKDAWDKYGGAVIDAAKRALTSLWGLLKEIGKTFQEIWESSAADEILGSILSIFAGILEFIATLADQFKEVWAETGADFVSAFFYAVSSIIKLIGSIGSAFAEAWNSGVGEEILMHIFSILTGIFNIVGLLASRLREAWEANNNGVEIWKSILNIISAVLRFIDEIVKATFAWVWSIDFEPLISSVRNLLKAFEPLVDIILERLALAYTEILLPLGKWTIEKAAPALLDLLSAALEALTAVLDALKPLGIWFWENFLSPMGEFTGGVIVSVIDAITDALNRFTAWARENPEIIQLAAEAIFSLLAGIVAYYSYKKITDIILSIGTAFKLLAGSFTMANVQAGLAVLAFAAIATAVIALERAWDSMNGIEKIVAVLGLFAAAAFAAALAFASFQSALTMGAAAVGVVAGIVAITAAINSAVSRAESISKGSFTGGFGSVGFGRSGGLRAIPDASTYSLPKLADGAVIPPNRQFAAILGDQRGGTNIEAPLSVIEQAVRNVVGENGGIVEIHVEMPVHLDGREIYRNQQVVSRQMGKSFVKVGS